MILNILTRDAEFFTAVLTGAQASFGGLTQIRCFDRLPESIPPGPVLADISENGITSAGIPGGCDGIITDAENIPEDYDGCRILKYQPVGKLLDGLSRLCFSRAGGGRDKNTNCRTVCFTSASGGAGVSTLARAAVKCENNGENDGKKAFYLDLSAIPDIYPEISADGPCMSDIMFALGDKTLADPETVLPMLAYTDEGVGFIRPGRRPAERAGITSEKVIKLLEMLKNSGKFGFIAVDCPYSETGLFRDISFECSCTVLVIRGDNDTKAGILAKELEGGNLLTVRNRSACEGEGVCVPDYAGYGFADTVEFAAEMLREKCIFGGKVNEATA